MTLKNIENGRVTIIAEIGVNHNGNLRTALELVDAAAKAKADVVKLQTFVPELVISPSAPKASYQKETTGNDGNQLEMVRSLCLDGEAHHAILKHCAEKNISFLSTPFDLTSLHFLIEDLKLTTVKLSSADITNGPLLYAAARKAEQLIISTGLCTIEEIAEALDLVAFAISNIEPPLNRKAFEGARHQPGVAAKLKEKIILLHCVTEYPAPIEELNLKAMDSLAKTFAVPVGYSDHSLGIIAPIAAAARGACLIEKHFTLDKNMPGPDHRASLEPNELSEMVRSIRQVEKSLGNGIKQPSTSELQNLDVVRRSLTASRDIAAGELTSEDSMVALRPSGGRSPMDYWDILNKPAPQAYRKGQPL